MNKTIDMEERIANWVYNWVLSWGVGVESANLVKLLFMLGCLVLMVVLLDWISRKVLVSLVRQYASRTESPLMKLMAEQKTFKFLGHLVPLVFARLSLPVVLQGHSIAEKWGGIVLGLLTVLAIHAFVKSWLQVLKAILMNLDSMKDKPIASFAQLAGIIVTLLAVLFGISIVTSQSILNLLTALGAMSAALLLVFKDTLTGLSASIRISQYDMLRNGDWVEFQKYGADGTVIDINLSSVKIQNFDNTYTTIPTGAFTTDSFKNWRGMEESQGRRIKRAIHIKQHSVKFCDEVMLRKLSESHLLKDYIVRMTQEINEFNLEVERTGKGVKKQLTNIGLFRVYLKNLLLENPHISKELNVVVRQLSPSDKGVPVEIYCFSEEKSWVKYEDIQSDIFDHVIASISMFDLDIFESPSTTSELIQELEEGGGNDDK
jgi:miniconductance mechanosensitive channel